jgi:hypothetical protein
MKDISPFTVSILNQGDPGRPVRVVLDRSNDPRHSQLVPFPVDLPILPLMTASPTPSGDVAVMVPSARFFLGLKE